MKLCTCTGHCRGAAGLGEGWVCSSDYWKQQAADERMKSHPADPIGELDPYEGCCHWCGKRGCDGDCRCPGCGIVGCAGGCQPDYWSIVNEEWDMSAIETAERWVNGEICGANPSYRYDGTILSLRWRDAVATKEMSKKYVEMFDCACALMMAMNTGGLTIQDRPGADTVRRVHEKLRHIIADQWSSNK